MAQNPDPRKVTTAASSTEDSHALRAASLVADASRALWVEDASVALPYIADSLNHRIRRIGANGFITTVAGSGVRGYYGDGGAARHAQLNAPLGVFVDSEGNLLIADSGNQAIRKVTPGGIIVTVAGSGARGFGGDGGAAVLAAFYSPSAVVA